jgi:hypothetical protein
MRIEREQLSVQSGTEYIKSAAKVPLTAAMLAVIHLVRNFPSLESFSLGAVGFATPLCVCVDRIHFFTQIRNPAEV